MTLREKLVAWAKECPLASLIEDEDFENAARAARILAVVLDVLAAWPRDERV